jgi:hypothetical protein
MMEPNGLYQSILIRKTCLSGTSLNYLDRGMRRFGYGAEVLMTDFGFIGMKFHTVLKDRWMIPEIASLINIYKNIFIDVTFYTS